MSSALVRHASADAPSRDEFKRLLRAAGLADTPGRRVEDRFICHASGRLTLRSGELIHFHEGWVDRDRKIIKIPGLDDCSCRYCRERVQELAETHDDVDAEDALEVYWQPKYEASIRAIPYGYSERSIEIVETFVDEVGHLDVAQSTINRRVNTLQERASLDRLYPHALRAAAAFYWAEQGMEAHYLQALMGWEDMRVAVAYIQATGNQLADRINQLASTDTEEDHTVTDAAELPDPTAAVYDATDGTNPRSGPEPEYLHDDEESQHPPTIEETQSSTLDDFASA
ncbi:site-specific integrase [Halorubrum ezzemoulense]|uniref:site-specific integrase n=1 Tax=Halorubrum TaxID=56688 RepID=UPI0010F8F3CE|nr:MULTISPECIES: site-specific integrase [Halorubrum]MDB2225774.1 site-specific integrase [Halorubrum ezzemoulense]MDB2286846.1 site-specific integrase [Halorubrum ezzemoulense]TKX38117.1 site-specific integrase [Halorubrum sp. CGM4_25_10-8A]TKX75005.1 site-specific integrase [Halorubrum sp. GN11_10-6_MGM]